MGAGHGHSHADAAGASPASATLARRVSDRVRAWLGLGSDRRHAALGELPPALRRDELAPRYLAAERDADHRRAGAAAVAAMEAAMGRADARAADVWAHRALWHFQQGQMELQATRQARRIGDLRSAAGDPEGARRYYAEAIDEARDIGAEHEQGLAALGLGRALLDLGAVTEARRLAAAAVTLLERSGAPAAELSSARALLGRERPVGEMTEDGG